MINTQKETETEQLRRLLRDAIDKATDAEEAIDASRTLVADLRGRWLDDFEPTEETLHGIKRDFEIIQSYISHVLMSTSKALEDIRRIAECEGVSVCL